jgi:hypothetical protein
MYFMYFSFRVERKVRKERRSRRGEKDLPSLRNHPTLQSIFLIKIHLLKSRNAFYGRVFLKRGGCRSGEASAVFQSQRPLLLLSGVSLVRFFSTWKRNEQEKRLINQNLKFSKKEKAEKSTFSFLLNHSFEKPKLLTSALIFSPFLQRGHS